MPSFAKYIALLTICFSGSSVADPMPRDGRHDFDFNLGSWKTHIRILHKSAGTWSTFDGTAMVRKVWSNGAQLEEIEADGDSGHLEALVLFLYDPQSHQWSKSFASSSDGTLGTPMVGGLADGRLEMFDQEAMGGKTVLMRAAWTGVTATAQHFEESYSEDGGRNWTPYFIADVTRTQG